ncbi:hypothetical protein L218DRAFT_454469 [Marasmius fiardii PR-910]|nr:hypothetical protein L218DRAFT_454469 [Marasmius fiardii PR-910]
MSSMYWYTYDSEVPHPTSGANPNYIGIDARRNAPNGLERSPATILVSWIVVIPVHPYLGIHSIGECRNSFPGSAFEKKKKNNSRASKPPMAGSTKS